MYPRFVKDQMNVIYAEHTLAEITERRLHSVVGIIMDYNNGINVQLDQRVNPYLRIEQVWRVVMYESLGAGGLQLQTRPGHWADICGLGDKVDRTTHFALFRFAHKVDRFDPDFEALSERDADSEDVYWQVHIFDQEADA